MIQQIDANTDSVIKTWTCSIREIARSIGLSHSNIVKCINGERVTSGGYKWVKLPVNGDFADDDLESVTIEKNDNELSYSTRTYKSIRSEEEALVHFNVDTTKWRVKYLKCNVWEGPSKKGDNTPKAQYNQVKLTLVEREPSFEDIKDNIDDLLYSYKPTPVVYNNENKDGCITVELADFHIGADIRGLMRTKDFNLGILRDYLFTIANMVNSYKADKVYINLHGDYVETISGLNHDDSWKSIIKDGYGANIIILAHKLLSEDLISNIENVVEVNMVSGNHDRISAKRSMDNYGEGAKLLAYLIDRDYPNIKVNYDPLILTREIDGINHILTHGHFGISKKDVAKVISDYGDTTMYNLWSEGHLHSKAITRVLKSYSFKYETIDAIGVEELNYQKIVLRSLFTGNFYSESLGYSGHAGFMVTYNNGKGQPNIDDRII